MADNIDTIYNPELVINVLSEEQYQSIALPSDQELYLTPDDTDEKLAAKQDVIQVSVMPTAEVANVGKTVQWIGATSTYTNGYFYQCVSDGETPPTYSWVQVNVQPAPVIDTITNNEIDLMWS